MSFSSKAPYLFALESYLKNAPLSFQVPGHGGGKVVAPQLVGLLGQRMLRSDLTEVWGLDDLHQPDGACGEAQRLAALAFGADHTYFLVNGSTSGIHAMLLATVGPQDTVLVPRHAHRSVWGALMLCGATAALYRSSFDAELQAFGATIEADLLPVLDAHPQAKALLLVSPTYHGHVSDLVPLVRLAHERGLVVLVDEAWGAHFCFHPQLPSTALQAGADLVVQSTHKMLSSLTQTAMLHLSGTRVSRSRVNRMLRLLLTSSPSAPFVASLDAARAHYETCGKELIEQASFFCDSTAKKLVGIPGVRCRWAQLGAQDWDPLHLFLQIDGWSGYELEKHLFDRDIAVEMAEARGVLLVWASVQDPAMGDHFVRAIESVVREVHTVKAKAIDLNAKIFLESTICPRIALDAEGELVDWKDAQGLISAEAVTLYPPGIPWLLPGEPVALEVVQAMRIRLAQGARIQGATDPHLESLRVIRGDLSRW